MSNAKLGVDKRALKSRASLVQASRVSFCKYRKIVVVRQECGIHVLDGLQ